MRILFVSGEVAPFTKATETSDLVRTLPERLQEEAGHEARIMMPRYGTISERRNRLHEVIRLSGTEVPMGEDAETLKVKVASIPGIRLQVYFMDSPRYFKRKGLHADKQGKVFEDNTARAAFFGRSVIETIRKLGWAPDVVHAFGWVSSFVPLLLRTEYATDALFEQARIVYTPDDVPAQATLTADLASSLGLDADAALYDRDLNGVGVACADLALFPPSLEPNQADALRLSGNEETLVEEAVEAYDQVLSVAV